MIQDNAASPVAQGDRFMLKLLLHWILSAIALLIVSRLVPGFVVQGIGPALIAALVIGLLNATLGFLLKIITFPLTILSLGLFLLVINGLMILVASGVVPGFKVYGMVPAFWGAVVLAILGVLFRYILKDSKDYPGSRARSR
jgi:putative membrane protein